jgi:hypothetical protein
MGAQQGAATDLGQHHTYTTLTTAQGRLWGWAVYHLEPDSGEQCLVLVAIADDAAAQRSHAVVCSPVQALPLTVQGVIECPWCGDKGSIAGGQWAPA